MTQTQDWFLADKVGMRQIAERLVERRGFGIIAGELFQNAMDTDATICHMVIEKVQSSPSALLSVRDNSTTGFSDLRHAYTLFAPSGKKIDPSKAGRFNLGEKMVLSFCRKATIQSMTGTVQFDDDGRQEFPRRKIERGTIFDAVIDCTTDRMKQLLDYCDQLLVKPGLEFRINGRLIEPRQPIREFTTTLATEVAGDDGVLRKSSRQCMVQIFEPLPNEVAMLYELGIPVVETEDKWTYNVLQKVPLNVDRDNVTPAYLRDLRVAVLNEMHELIEETDTTSTWVEEATSSDDCDMAALETFRIKKYGEKSVALDPTNPEANAEATSHGFTVIPPRGLTPGQRENMYNSNLLKTSSQAFPLAGKGAYGGGGGEPVKVIEESEWTDGMKEIHEYTVEVANRLLKKDVSVRFVSVKHFAFKRWVACYGRGHSTGTFDYNIHTLGRKWFANGVTEQIDSLILHELAHNYESNHLCEEYYEACTNLGARLKQLALQDPAWFGKFIR